MNVRSWMTVVATVGTLACGRNIDPTVGRRAAEKASEHVTEGSAAVERLTTGLVEVTRKAARDIAPSVDAPVNVARVRNFLTHELHDDHTEVGRDLTLYPTWFLAVAGVDGKGIAGDRAPDQDFIPDKDLGAAFPCVRTAIAGTGGHCVGEMASAQGQETRVYLVAAQPIHAADGTTRGVMVAAINYGRLAKAVRETLNLRTARDNVQLHVGFLRNGRVLPSGHDNDVAQAYLVPDVMLPRIPRDAGQRVAGGGFFTFTFTENQGRMQWGVAVGQVSALGDTAMIVFRAPLRQ